MGQAKRSFSRRTNWFSDQLHFRTLTFPGFIVQYREDSVDVFFVLFSLFLQRFWNRIKNYPAPSQRETNRELCRNDSEYCTNGMNWCSNYHLPLYTDAYNGLRYERTNGLTLTVIIQTRCKLYLTEFRLIRVLFLFRLN